LHAASREGEPANHGDYTRWGAVVALLAAAVLLVLAWPRGGPPRPGTAADPGALRGAQGGITALRGEGVTARDQATLEWSAVPGAVRYELHVSTPELEPVLSERSLPTPRAVLPEAILRPMPAGTELLWRVEAVLDDEQRVVSPTFSLTVELRARALVAMVRGAGAGGRPRGARAGACGARATRARADVRPPRGRGHSRARAAGLPGAHHHALDRRSSRRDVLLRRRAPPCVLGPGAPRARGPRGRAARLGHAAHGA